MRVHSHILNAAAFRPWSKLSARQMSRRQYINKTVSDDESIFMLPNLQQRFNTVCTLFKVRMTILAIAQ